jgi:hypothetical protein
MVKHRLIAWARSRAGGARLRGPDPPDRRAQARPAPLRGTPCAAMARNCSAKAALSANWWAAGSCPAARIAAMASVNSAASWARSVALRRSVASMGVLAAAALIKEGAAAADQAGAAPRRYSSSIKIGLRSCIYFVTVKAASREPSSGGRRGHCPAPLAPPAAPRPGRVKLLPTPPPLPTPSRPLPLPDPAASRLFLLRPPAFTWLGLRALLATTPGLDLIGEADTAAAALAALPALVPQLLVLPGELAGCPTAPLVV